MRNRNQSRVFVCYVTALFSSRPRISQFESPPKECSWPFLRSSETLIKGLCNLEGWSGSPLEEGYLTSSMSIADQLCRKFWRKKETCGHEGPHSFCISCQPLCLSSGFKPTSVKTMEKLSLTRRDQNECNLSSEMTTIFTASVLCTKIKLVEGTKNF